MTDENSPKDKLGILQVMQSVLAASIGVQSNKNRERDFKKGSAKTFIIAGIIGTILFVLTIFSIVKLVLKAAS
ncbi:MAG: DUF2970 domain-containing protein [Gammaproteobacteria bacterium]|nr:DUF2970 domain-containing protein [Gammaproteobacteria bacterium]